MPDPDRVGGLRWLDRTNGALTWPERARFARPIAEAYLRGLSAQVHVRLGRRPHEPLAVPMPPDSRMTRAALDAAAEQPAVLLGHAHRTWAFGHMLAEVDGKAGLLDEELFYVASLLHDVGLVEAVTGQDFTLRSAAAARPIVEEERNSHDADRVCGAIVAHATPGASLDVDGPDAYYVQQGATCDLAGMRLHELSVETERAVLALHPRTGVESYIVDRIVDEARRNKAGRFNLLRWTGFTWSIRFNPLPR